MYDAYFGNKSICINQRRYLGSKTKLLDFIDSILSDEKIEFKSFADIFAGTGTVACHFHSRSQIVVNDILDSNSHIYHAFFGREKINENKLLSSEPLNEKEIIIDECNLNLQIQKNDMSCCLIM